jgi:starch synthase
LTPPPPRPGTRRAWFHSLQERVMRQDWSWNRPAIDYIELYHSAMKA